MNVLILGSGGRECAIATYLSKSKEIGNLYALPGNGGIAKVATCLPGSVLDKEAVIKAAKEHAVSYVVVTPDDPLAIGMVDALEAEGITCFGPRESAARIESSKSFAKELMKKYGIPTASYEVFTESAKAIGYVKGQKLPIVIKADGLALGKGVIIATTLAEAEEAIRSMLDEGRFGESGRRIVIEEFLTGPEVTVLSFTDGRTLLPMVSSMDHKRAYDGDKGPNTGGMGVIAPNPYYTKEIAKECQEKIFLPTIRAMEAEGCPFRGCLYFGLMLTAEGPKVIEYNSRFGDPETQTILPLLENDLFEVMRATSEGRLDEISLSFKSCASVCIVLASGGYPGSYEKGKVIETDDGIEGDLFVAGAKEEGGRLVTSGGRVLDLTVTAPTLSEAQKKAYEEVKKIRFEGMEFRHDIGKKALEAL